MNDRVARHVGNISLVLVVGLGLALSATARANLTLVDTYKSTPENTDHILSVAGPILGVSNLTSLLRLEDRHAAPSGSPFTISYPSNGVADISWNLAGTGTDLLGVYIFGGSNGANLYRVTDPAQMISGSAEVHTPVTGNSGQFAGVSHILFLGGATAVPEPSALTLMVGGLFSLVGLQRYRRRSR